MVIWGGTVEWRFEAAPTSFTRREGTNGASVASAPQGCPDNAVYFGQSAQAARVNVGQAR